MQQWIVLSVELSFEWSMDLSPDRLHSEWIGEDIQLRNT